MHVVTFSRLQHALCSVSDNNPLLSVVRNNVDILAIGLLFEDTQSFIFAEICKNRN